ncbi:hypothetical protein VTK73DRAFT_435 [Phialemonium thermophilum]|uniref:Copper acquisition factor BIM1-like domain-containing protein n=1 Tax=Phialemonium thermophilum TaxID=223376 RepID=A0ABR3XEH2_9PEZI
MGKILTVVVVLGWVSALVRAQTISDDMGPAGFLWPPDRVWNADKDNTAPCGSPAGVGNRTGFPITNGKLALVDQDEGFNIQISVSYSNSEFSFVPVSSFVVSPAFGPQESCQKGNGVSRCQQVGDLDPTTNADFTTLIPSTNFKELLRGHTCVPVADPPRSVSVGSNATFQLVYTAEDFDNSPGNQTYYACADVTYVLQTSEADTFCFNATEPETQQPSSTSGSNSPATASPTPSSAPASGSRSGHHGVSGGAIAGAVVGSVVGATILGLAGLWYFRRRQRQRRIAEMTRNSRNVPWSGPAPITGKDSTSQHSVGLQDM